MAEHLRLEHLNRFCDEAGTATAGEDPSTAPRRRFLRNGLLGAGLLLGGAAGFGSGQAALLRPPVP